MKQSLLKWGVIFLYTLFLVLIGFKLGLGKEQCIDTQNISKVSEISASEVIEKYDLLELINQYRESKGLSILKEHSALMEGAEYRAKYLIENKLWSHDGWVEIANQFIRKHFRGENLARNFSTDKQIINAWIASPKHKDILDDKDYYSAGIGRYDEIVVLWVASED